MDSHLRLRESEYENNALHNFFIHATLPLIAKIGEEFCVIGTGTLFKIAGRHFIVTAAHILEDFAADRWAFPTGPHKGTIMTLGASEFLKPNDESVDICVIELKDQDAIACLEREWRFLTLGNVWLPDLSATSVFLSGFPSVRAKFDGENLRGRLFVVRSNYYTGVPESAKSAKESVQTGVDFFVQFKNSVNELTGENVGDVQIQGTSGCSIWAYREQGWAKHGFWSPEVALRVIGVQSAYVRNDYLRVKNWGVVLRLLMSVDDDIRGEVAPIIDMILAKTKSASPREQFAVQSK